MPAPHSSYRLHPFLQKQFLFHFLGGDCLNKSWPCRIDTIGRLGRRCWFNACCVHAVLLCDDVHFNTMHTGGALLGLDQAMARLGFLLKIFTRMYTRPSPSPIGTSVACRYILVVCSVKRAPCRCILCLLTSTFPIFFSKQKRHSHGRL
jgi:hypothetical protein